MLLESLIKFWGYSKFRENQENICRSLLDGRDAFVLMSTGTGKSLMYQLPAVCLREQGVVATSIVVSPLISLMEDQVASLRAMGIRAGMIGSKATYEDEENAREGKLTVLYLTPEKALSWKEGFLKVLKHSRVVCIAVDESHCVSEWGHDFRPEYQRLGLLRSWCTEVGLSIPIVALTATATAAVQRDIIRSLHLTNPVEVTSSFNRSNLKYSVLPRTSSKDVVRYLLKLRPQCIRRAASASSTSTTSSERTTVVNPSSFPSTVIYVKSRKCAEEFTEECRNCTALSGIGIACYHAGMTLKDREIIQTAFMCDQLTILVATIAFGMGINKADIRLVLHYGIPGSLEAYFQQTGRAGRDGLPSECVLFYHSQDPVKAFNIAFNGELNRPMLPTDTVTSGGPNSSHRIQEGIQLMANYASQASICRRSVLLSYFAPCATGASPSSSTSAFTPNCCDVCDAHGDTTGPSTAAKYTSTGERVQLPNNVKDMTLEISKEIIMLLQTVQSCGLQYGIGMAISILQGYHNKTVQRIFEYSKMEYFGQGKKWSQSWWKELSYQLCTDPHRLLEARFARGAGFGYQVHVVTQKGLSVATSLQPHASGLSVGSTATSTSVNDRTSDNEGLNLHTGKYFLIPCMQLYVQSLSCQKLRGACNHSTGTDRTHAKEASKQPSVEVDNPLFPNAHLNLLDVSLRHLRSELSVKVGVNPYNILSSADMKLLCECRPIEVTELSLLPGGGGWGEGKRTKFGQCFVECIRNYLSDHDLPLVSNLPVSDTSVESPVTPTVDTDGEGVEGVDTVDTRPLSHSVVEAASAACPEAPYFTRITQPMSWTVSSKTSEESSVSRPTSMTSTDGSNSGDSTRRKLSMLGRSTTLPSAALSSTSQASAVSRSGTVSALYRPCYEERPKSSFDSIPLYPCRRAAHRCKAKTQSSINRCFEGDDVVVDVDKRRRVGTPCVEADCSDDVSGVEILTASMYRKPIASIDLTGISDRQQNKPTPVESALEAHSPSVVLSAAQIPPVEDDEATHVTFLPKFSKTVI